MLFKVFYALIISIIFKRKYDNLDTANEISRLLLDNVFKVG